MMRIESSLGYVPIQIWRVSHAGVWCYRDDIETKLVTICSYERSHSLHNYLCCTLFYRLVSQALCELHSKIWLQFLCSNMNIVIKTMPQCCKCISYPFHWDDLSHQTPQILQSECMLFHATTIYFHLIHSNTWSCLFVGRQEWLPKGSVHRTCQTHHLQLSSLKIFWAHDHWWVQPWLESGRESRLCGKFNSPILVHLVLSFECQGVWYFLLAVGNPLIAARIGNNYCEGGRIWCHLVIRVRIWVVLFCPACHC